jgi:diguanylate cyclase (GGDEF)-like protein/PAS domain S-box-containing protein
VSNVSLVITILLLEDDTQNSKSIEHLLSQINSTKFSWTKFQKLSAGLNYLKQNQVDVVLINLKLTESRKLNIQQKIYVITPKITILFVTNNSEENTTIQNYNLAIDYASYREENALEYLGIQDYLDRESISPTLLEKSIFSAIEQQATREKLIELRQDNLQLKSQLQYIHELFTTVVDTTSFLMWMLDTHENYTFLNQAWLSFTGQTLETGFKENWRDRIHPEDLPDCIQAYQLALTQCQGFEIEYRLRRFDDTYRLMLNTAVRRHNSQGEFAGFLCSCLDITQRKKIEQQVIQQAKTDRILADITQKIHSSLELNIILQTTAEAVNQVLLAEKILITKIIDNLSSADSKINCKLNLLFESKLVNLPLNCKISTTETLPNQELLDNFEQLSQGAIVAKNDTYTNIIIDSENLDFTSVAYTLLLVPILAHEQLWGLICVENYLPPKYWQLEEIKLLRQVAIRLGIAIKQSELYQKLEQANQELEELAVIDGLTKIANRRKFDQYLQGEWKRLTREKSPLSLILCDIDYFKLYNDTYGHQAGDRCLSKVAQAIGKVIKRPADLVARYGGEEFAVILPHTNIIGAKYLAQQIRLQIEALKIPHINSAIDLYVTLSLGVASCIPSGGVGFYTLVAAADKGLYQAKELGRNRVAVFEMENLCDKI